MALRTVTACLLVLSSGIAPTEFTTGRNPGGPDSVRLRADGVYSLLDTSWTPDHSRRWNEVCAIYSPVIFFNDSNALCLSGRSFPDSSVLRLESHSAQGRDIDAYIGTFSLNGDTISATLPTDFALRGMRMKKFTAHYRGILKNSDTIVEWRMVPPYPNVNEKFNAELNQLLRAPHTLFFVQSRELLGLDSLYRRVRK